MNNIEILSIICSIIGAILFIIAVYVEVKIIKKLEVIKKSTAWWILLIFTVFFIAGYVINILGIIGGFVVLQQVFGALVFLIGAIFLLMVIMVSFNTYRSIFDELKTS